MQEKLFENIAVVLLTINTFNFNLMSKVNTYYDFQEPFQKNYIKENYVQSAVQRIAHLDNLNNREAKDIKITLDGKKPHKYFFMGGKYYYAKYLENCKTGDIRGNRALRELDKNYKCREIAKFLTPNKYNFELLFAKYIVKIPEKKDYILIMNRALGKSLKDLINGWHIRGIPPILKKAFYLTGKAIGRLHMGVGGKPNLQKTLIHGDLHFENVFFDPESGKISIIDFEDFRDSGCATIDLEIFFKPFSIFGKYGAGREKISPELMKYLKINFISGYCSTLKVDKKEKIRLLKSVMADHTDFPPEEIEHLVHAIPPDK